MTEQEQMQIQAEQEFAGRLGQLLREIAELRCRSCDKKASFCPRRPLGTSSVTCKPTRLNSF